MPKNIRPIRVEINVAYVPLTKGYEAIIDAEDIHLVNRWNWSARVAGKSVYARRVEKMPDGTAQDIKMHIVIAGAVGQMVDHRNGLGLDNRRANLRVATKQQNQCNQPLRSDSTSGLKGVSWKAARQKWRAYITAHGKRQHLGHFDSKEAAHAAYCDASARLHGEFGRTA